MARSLEQLISDADQIIEKRAAAPKAQAAVDDGEVVKLASLLAAKDAPQADTFQMTMLEKVAHSIAIVETIQQLEQLEKIAKFEEGCRGKGFSEDQINAFLEKRGFKEVSKYVVPAGLAGLAGLAYGHHKGKEKGYRKALGDVQSAFSSPQPE